jgi:threonylcarbamoyladenosine tRNA methylthiotransferase MtaB
VPDRLLKLIGGSDILCPHLHICAQAGDDEILKRMRRNYDTGYYRELLLKTREYLPEAALGSDIIVGFPGETEQQFEEALEFFTSLPLTYFHVFPYSERRGTVAASLPNRLSANTKRVRAGRMRELGVRKKRRFCSTFLGRTARVLVEEKVDNRTGCHRGFSRNYLPVVVRGGSCQANREVDVKIDGWDGDWLTGTVMEQKRAVEVPPP